MALKKSFCIFIEANSVYCFCNLTLKLVLTFDKSKATVILYKHEYTKKVHTFLTGNNFHTLPDNPTNKYQIRIQKTAQKCNKLSWNNTSNI